VCVCVHVYVYVGPLARKQTILERQEAPLCYEAVLLEAVGRVLYGWKSDCTARLDHATINIITHISTEREGSLALSNKERERETTCVSR
jgi:hypothetical protein